MHTLLPHQDAALAYAKPRERMALFMEMRLGKGVVTLRWAQHHRLRRVLLVAPYDTLPGSLNWEGEIAREMLPSTRLFGLTAEARLSRARWRWEGKGTALTRKLATGWFLINYEALRATPDILGLPWDGIILDESTAIRNPKAAITKLLARPTSADTCYVDHIEYRAILTGLPNPESPLDYFCQCKFVFGQFNGWTNYYSFRQTRFHNTWSHYAFEPNPGTREEIKEFVHSTCFIMTRKHADVGGRKVQQMRAVPMNDPQERLFKQVQREFAFNNTETKWAAVVHTWLQKIAGGFTPDEQPELCNVAKYQLLTKLLTEDFRDEPVVVWFRFNHELITAHKWLRLHASKRKPAMVYGAIKDRSTIQQAFHDTVYDVLLMQIGVASYGWNLSNADTAIYYSNSYEYEDRAQTEDRLIHIAKRTDCLYVDLVTTDSTDEDVVDALSQKKRDAKHFTLALAERISKRLERCR